MRDVRMSGFRERTSVHAALAVLEARTGLLEAEEAHVTEAAGRVAAEDVAAAASVPHFTRAAMDGYAVVGESTFGATLYAPVELAVLGDARPGVPFSGRVASGQAVGITTGAPMPEGADAVVMVEHADEVGAGGGSSGRVVRVTQPVAPGKHVGRIGEDVEAGTVVVPRARRLRPQDAGVLASTGVARVPVVRRPRVRILVTGDELLPPGSKPDGPRIVDSNSVVLAALVRRDAAELLGVAYVPDRRERVREALSSATEDVVLVSGGSSVGPEDHAPLVLAEIGELSVHGVAMRPASPAGFGFMGPGRKQVVFLLPGNPVSCLCAYELFAGPTLRAMGGLPREWPHARVRAPLAAKIVSELGRMDYVRVKLTDGRVTPLMTTGASILSSTTRADGVVLVPEGEEGHPEGHVVEVFLYA